MRGRAKSRQGHARGTVDVVALAPNDLVGVHGSSELSDLLVVLWMTSYGRATLGWSCPVVSS